MKGKKDFFCIYIKNFYCKGEVLTSSGLMCLNVGVEAVKVD